ncbi:efflux RND transporter periplasmic adaptor subunit [Glycomyces sp. MUSA5-2]|uniref:efflux RND transporter periplasmic adaptor subunit n=1 Tax=Glycomyces sp. MUSA5-2 TaxID=2053002 RepID=UPI003008D0B5
MRTPAPVVLVNGGLALALAVGGGATYLLLRGTDLALLPAAEAAEEDVAASTTATAEVGSLTRTVAADGTVTAASTLTAEFANSGTVTDIAVQVGDVVEAGQQLATIDSADAERDLETAEENLDAAEDSLDRAESDSEIEQAEQAVDDAEDAVEEAEQAVDDTVLTAPGGGTVIAVNGTVGGSSGAAAGSGSDGTGMTGDDSGSTASEGFIEIADLSDLTVTASVAEGDATDVAVGQAVQTTWNALDASIGGELLAVSPTSTADGSVAAYDVTVSLAELPEGVRLGQTVSVSITVEEAQDVLYVPTAAVEGGGDAATVTLIGDDGTRTETSVVLGVEGDSGVEIVSGLAEGDTVAVTVDESDTGTGEFTFPGGGGTPEGGFPAGGSGGGGGFPAGGGLPGGS